MADLSSFAQTVDNAGDTVALLTDNFKKHSLATSDAGQELVIKIVKSGSGNITDTVLEDIRNNITLPGGVNGALPADTGDAFTVAGFGTANGTEFVSGTTTTVFMRVQGLGGVFDTTDAAGATGATVTVEAVFKPRF
jgi:hypothetical protein